MAPQDNNAVAAVQQSTMASLQGIPTPTIDWSSSCLDESYENFKETCELIFDGPLSGLDEKRKINYLKLWCGNEGRALIKTWLLSDADKVKIDKYWTNFKEYVKPKSNFRLARFKLRACRQEEGEAIDVYVKKLRIILAECKYPAEQCNEPLIDAFHRSNTGDMRKLRFEAAPGK